MDDKQCRNAGKRLPESDYSHTYNPKKCLAVKAPRSFSQCTQNTPTFPAKLSGGDRSRSEGPVNTERTGDGPDAGSNDDCAVKVEPDKKQLAKKQQLQEALQAVLQRTASEGTVCTLNISVGNSIFSFMLFFILNRPF